MRLIDADALIDQLTRFQRKLHDADRELTANQCIAFVENAPTVDAVPSTDVDELKMRLIGAEAAINGMREQINRMVIINSEKVSVVRCKECAKRGTINCDLDYCGYRQADNWYCADGEEKE